ncbi:hypothetical protein PGTUg99_014438 [Puccinia graminis f. sp. tritici]|uniref:Uncharacterized protein n=1 Tax=Puccinia graminis f. sp. tritici TaxID=56615 RepID=A0A5B0QLH4_PUCGR|nr:hypothetical protein PGTUg99_014438 [Puccinia graminis f. sp. tritici]
MYSAALSTRYCNENADGTHNLTKPRGIKSTKKEKHIRSAKKTPAHDPCHRAESPPAFVDRNFQTTFLCPHANGTLLKGVGQNQTTRCRPPADALTIALGSRHYGQLAVAAARSVTQTFQVKLNPHATSAAATTQSMKQQITLHTPAKGQ